MSHAPTPPNSVRQTALLAGFVALCALGMVGCGWWLERERPQTDLTLEDQPLYGNDRNMRRMSLAFNGLVADWYWMRSLQYVGRKALRSIEAGENIQLDDLSNLNLKLLAPMLERTTTLDPHFIPAYAYGGIVLPAVNQEAAIKLLEKGIANNPNEWRLYQHLGYIYWKRQEYQKASDAYSAGGRIPGAPSWLPAISARMLNLGGNRDTAREIYRRLAEEASDASLKQMAELRLAEVDSFDERDAIRQAIKAFNARTGRCPTNWRELQNELRAARLPNGQPLVLDAAGAPVDPSNAPYALTQAGCEVALGPQTKLPFQ
jgi:tetratricopeptide (TPR) repeat protein